MSRRSIAGSAYPDDWPEIAQWPERYATVREAIALGFWPDAYGNIEDDTSILAPPMKFAYPRAGVAHPLHADGVAAGASLWLWSFAHGDPDELRPRPVWQAAIEDIAHPLRWRRHGGTFDETVAWCLQQGDEMAAHYLVPEYDPATRLAALPVRHWRELAAVVLPFDAIAPPPAATQLTLFAEPPAPGTEHAWTIARRRMREWLPTVDAADDTVVRGPIDPLGVADLVALANQRRLEAIEAKAVAA